MSFGRITRIEHHVLESESGSKTQNDQAFSIQHLIDRVEGYDAEFKEQHLKIVSLLNDGKEDAIEIEQNRLDNHDDKTADIMNHLYLLMHVDDKPAELKAMPPPSPKPEPSKPLRLVIIRAGMT